MSASKSLAAGGPSAAEAANTYQEDKLFYQDEHFLEQIIHRSANCIIVANTHNKEIDPVSYISHFII